MTMYKWEWVAFQMWCKHSAMTDPLKLRLEYLQGTEYWLQYRDMIQYDRPDYGNEQIEINEEFVKNDHKGNPIFRLKEEV